MIDPFCCGSPGERRHLTGIDERTAELDVGNRPPVCPTYGDDHDPERAAGVASHGGGLLTLDRLDDRGLAEQAYMRFNDLERVVFEVAAVPLGPLRLVENETDGSHA